MKAYFVVVSTVLCGVCHWVCSPEGNANQVDNPTVACACLFYCVNEKCPQFQVKMKIEPSECEGIPA